MESQRESPHEDPGAAFPPRTGITEGRLDRHRGLVIRRRHPPGFRSPLVSVWLVRGYRKRDFSPPQPGDEEIVENPDDLWSPRSPKARWNPTFSSAPPPPGRRTPLLWENRPQGKSLGRTNGRCVTVKDPDPAGQGASDRKRVTCAMFREEEERGEVVLEVPSWEVCQRHGAGLGPLRFGG